MARLRGGSGSYCCYRLLQIVPFFFGRLIAAAASIKRKFLFCIINITFDAYVPAGVVAVLFP